VAGRRFPARSVVRGPKRQTTWIGPADQGYLAVGAGAKVLIASFDPFAAGLPKPTVVRTRGNVSIRQGTGIIVDTEIVGAFGLAVVSDQAFTIGITAIPGPFNDSGWDGWFVWGSFSIAYEAVGTSETLLMTDRQFEVDSKAMRKVTENETIVLVAESQGVALRASMPLRMLMKLS